MSWRVRSNSLDSRRGDFSAFRRELLSDWPVSAANLVVLSTTDSTNALARRTLERAPARRYLVRTLFGAWSQTEGRGRGGRVWSSGPGQGVWMSILEPLSGAVELAQLPTLLPVALCRALRDLGVPGCGLKWPNDLAVEGRKLGGMLIEAVTTGDRPVAAILGFGVNFLPPDPPLVAQPTVGVAELVEHPITLGQLGRQLAERVLESLSAPPSDLVERYRELSVHHPGERLVCRLAGETIEGAFAGFDARGFLLLGVEGDLRTISAGEIVER